MSEAADTIIKKHIAIIRAGLSGISVLRRLLENDNFRLTCFERNYDIGGQWLYSDETSQNVFGQPISTALYKNLPTNLPKYLMEVEGYEHDDDTPTYLKLPEVFEYLTRITATSNIRRFILLNTVVKQVEPVDPDNRETKWMVTYGDVRKKNDSKCETFDAVIACNGNCVKVNYPLVENEESFGGTIIHSKQFRRPEMFVGQSVAILGAMFSGADISIAISDYAKKIYLCHRGNKVTYSFPENVEEKQSGFKSFTTNSIILENGCKLEVDTVIYCTGYRFSFPFLSQNIIKLNGAGRACNLFKETLSADYNTLAVMNLPQQTASFTIADYQALFIRAVLEGIAKLPDAEKIKEITFHEYENRPVDIKSLWNWQRELSEIAGNFPPASARIVKTWNVAIDLLLHEREFRSYVYTFTASGSVTAMRSDKH